MRWCKLWIYCKTGLEYFDGLVVFPGIVKTKAHISFNRDGERIYLGGLFKNRSGFLVSFHSRKIHAIPMVPDLIVWVGCNSRPEFLFSRRPIPVKIKAIIAQRGVRLC